MELGERQKRPSIAAISECDAIRLSRRLQLTSVQFYNKPNTIYIVKKCHSKIRSLHLRIYRRVGRNFGLWIVERYV
jgi:hypothetical protein